jgi:hypothetical protein
MSAYSRTRRITHLTCINARIEWIIGYWVFVRSLGWDTGHHERFRNGPENKIHIMESSFLGVGKVLDFFGRVPECSRKFRRAPWWCSHAPKGPHGPKGAAYMGLVVHAHLSNEAKGKTLEFSYGPRQRKLRMQVFCLGPPSWLGG